MMTDASWVGAIDHRISSAIVFFVLGLMLSTPPKRKHFGLVVLPGLPIMCVAAWTVRYVSDVVFTNILFQGLGHSAQILILFLLFLIGYRICYRVSSVEATYMSILALTIFKIAWNGFKAGGSLFLVGNVPIIWSQYSPMGSLVSYIVYFTICLIFCLIYKNSVSDPTLHMPGGIMASLAAITVLCQMILEYCGHVFTGSSSAEFLYYLCALLYTILNFVALVLIANVDSFRHENRNMHDFINNKMHYYEMSHDGILALQTKCHDLKHQIAAVRSEAGKASFDRYLIELEDTIDEYSTVVESGNQTVDIVLTEKNILCKSAGVKFTYMIDGSLFSFLSDREIYSLFGNALDNALEAASKVADESNRMISLKSNVRGDLVVLQIENTYEGEIHLEDGLPHTTKQGSGHGFGLRSIQRIAQRWGGDMSVRAENGIFKLSVIMRAQQEPQTA